MDEDAREVAELSLRWDRAVQERDVSDAQDVLHEDYALALVRPARAVMTRAQWLALLPDYVVDEWNIREQVIDVDGDVAAVLQRVDMKAPCRAHLELRGSPRPCGSCAPDYRFPSPPDESIADWIINPRLR